MSNLFTTVFQGINKYAVVNFAYAHVSYDLGIQVKKCIRININLAPAKRSTLH